MLSKLISQRNSNAHCYFFATCFYNQLIRSAAEPA
ncbi:hypothetical protein EM595_2985 [Duffyella gerundensis]|uniref:Uncharacterized protein n=1 Tax=Duffyella gerundensis TaxID=1619313 RepID=A0A0U5L7V2_9GAMM|nr:hypothetical protein EM595_2985 [Duffyella gerundensis]